MTKYTPEKFLTVFWSRISRSPDPDGCWLWTGTVSSSGYGQTCLKGRLCTVHRISYELVFGAIPDGLRVLHKCDVRRCCNPAHLFLGTALDNAQDRDQKRRRTPQRGEQHGMAKLTWIQVLDIRQRYAAGGISQRALARDFNVAQKTVFEIVHNTKWQTDKD